WPSAGLPPTHRLDRSVNSGLSSAPASRRVYRAPDHAMTATVTATAATNGKPRRSATAQHTHTIRGNWEYARPEKRKIYNSCPDDHAHVDRQEPAVREPYFVHGFVHEMRRDGLRRGRRSGPGMNARSPSAEVSAAT